MFDVVGVGRNSWDRISLLPDYPPPNAKVEVLELVHQPGGQVATTLVTVARLGGTTRYLGKFGDDASGRAVRGALAHEGVELTESRVLPGINNQTAFVVVDKTHHTRTVFGDFDERLLLEMDDFPQEAINSGKILFLGGRNPSTMIPFAKMGKEAGSIIVLDADDPSDGAKELISLANVVIMPEPFLSDFTGERETHAALRRVSQLGPTISCVTKGQKGSCALWQKEYVEVPAFDIRVLDTTGAGDVFQGAFLIGLLENFELPHLLKFANAAAALKCRTLGGQSGIPPRADVEKFIQI